MDTNYYFLYIEIFKSNIKVVQMILKMILFMLSLCWLIFIETKGTVHGVIKGFFFIFLVGSVTHELIHNFTEVINNLWVIILFIIVSIICLKVLIYFYTLKYRK